LSRRASSRPLSDKPYNGSVLRVYLAILFAVPACAQPLDEAAERLARKVAATLRAAPPAAIFVENRSSLSTPVDRLRGILEREINKTAAVPPDAQRVTMYIADSASGPLLIAAVDCGESPCVSMERFRPEIITPRATLTVRPVLSQATPVLDFTLKDDSLAVLETDRVAVHKRAGDAWTPAASLPFTPAVPMPRDPRGRLFVHNGAYEIRIPGSKCAGVTMITCKADDSPWREGDIQLAWRPRRNTLVLPPGMTGEDFAQVSSDCGISRLSVGNNAVQAPGAQPLPLPGTPVALWSSETPGEASLVVFNPSTNEYEASRVAIRCDR
jgi:hypothetical protein